MERRTFNSALLAAFAATAIPSSAKEPATRLKARNVVLAHGLFADGSSWLEAIPHLQSAGLNVTSVQNPLTTLDEAVASCRRVLDRQNGPTVLAGHSFSGMIVTEAGAHPNVTSLVYVAARAPDAGEDYAALAKRFPAPLLRPGSCTTTTRTACPKRRSCAISPAICRRPKRAHCSPCNSHSAKRCLPGAPLRRHGVTSLRSMPSRRRTVRSIPTRSASWPPA
jgi:pimeloyl-ACP methyl ester carboxylesterase